MMDNCRAIYDSRMIAKETDVCFEFLPEGRDGGLVLGKVHFKVCKQVGMLLSEVVGGNRWIARVHMVSRALIRRSLADAGKRANAAVVLLRCW